MSKKHHKDVLSKKKIVILAGLILLLIVALVYSVLSITSYKKFTPDYLKALDVKGSASDAKYQKSINSTYNFSVNFDERQYTPIAYQVYDNGTRFVQSTGNDAYKTKDYASIVLYDKRTSSKDKAILLKSSDAELTVSTNVNKDFFERRKKEYGSNLSNEDLIEKHYAPKASGPSQTITKLNSAQVTINDVEYRKIIYRTTSSATYINLNEITEQYETIIDGKPYVAKVTYKEGHDDEFVSGLRSVIKNVNYGQPKQQSATYGSSNIQLNEKSSKNNSNDIANIPTTLKSNTALRVAAKNQPATVRIGTINCVDLSLMLKGKEYMRVDKACTAGIGSGSIISSKGYVSTNGHVARFTPSLALTTGLALKLSAGDKDSIFKYLNYLADSGAMSASQIDKMIEGIKSDDTDAINEFMYSGDLIARQNMKVNSDVYKYAVQLSNEPIHYTTNGSVLDFKYSSGIVEAKYIDSNFDPYSGSVGKQDLQNATTSDVALLKITSGDNYPVVKFGSIDNLKQGDLITAIGFPAFVDGGLDTKNSKTVPSITQGNVKGIIYDSPQKVRKLVGSDTPIGAGNSGGPAINQVGLQVGLNTYGNMGCPDDECFSSESYFRDIKDYKDLLSKNNVSTTTSALSDNWNTALTLFENGKYGEAKSKFEAAKSQYPALYLADNFIAQSNQAISLQNKHKLMYLISFLVGILLIAAIIYTILAMKKHKKSKQLNQSQPQQQTNQQLQSNAPIQQAQTAPVVQQQPQISAIPQPNQVISPQQGGSQPFTPQPIQQTQPQAMQQQVQRQYEDGQNQQ